MNPGEKDICNCGKRGCLEQYASATGIVRIATRMLKESSQPSELREQEKITARVICDLAGKGDKLSGNVLDVRKWFLVRGLFGLFTSRSMRSIFRNALLDFYRQVGDTMLNI